MAQPTTMERPTTAARSSLAPMGRSSLAPMGRRMALLGGAAGLLSGCSTISGWFVAPKNIIPGQRYAVMQVDHTVGVDLAAAQAPLNLPPAVSVSEWVQPGGNAAHVLGNVAYPETMKVAWDTPIGDGDTYRRKMVMGVLVADGTVFAMDAFARISALETSNGARRWHFDTRPKKDEIGALGGGLAYAKGVLYVVTGQSEAMALNAVDGKVLWREPLPAPARGAPLLVGDYMYFPTVENHLLVLGLADGKRSWTYRGDAVDAMPLGLATPAASGDVVVAGMPSGDIVALRMIDGSVVWSESLALGNGGSLGNIDGLAAAPVIDDGTVFAVGMGGLTIAIDMRSGRRLWEKDIGGVTMPWVAGPWVYMLTSGRRLMALSRADGGVRWITQLPDFENDRKQSGPIFYSPPIMAGGRLLLGGSRKELISVNPDDGTIIGRLPMRAGALMPLVVVDNSLYTLLEDGSVTAVR